MISYHESIYYKELINIFNHNKALNNHVQLLLKNDNVREISSRYTIKLLNEAGPIRRWGSDPENYYFQISIHCYCSGLCIASWLLEEPDEINIEKAISRLTSDDSTLMIAKIVPIQDDFELTLRENIMFDQFLDYSKNAWNGRLDNRNELIIASMIAFFMRGVTEDISLLRSQSLDDFDKGEELNVNDLEGRSISVEQLVGRNFYHYTDCEKDTKQPASYILSDFDLDESEDEDDDEDEYEDEDDCSDESGDLDDYLPDDCWVKRFVDDNDPNTCYLLYLSLDKDGNIDDSGCVVESSQRMGGGGFLFMIPGMELPGVKSYNYESNPPDKVMDDLRLLFKGRVLPLDFSFVGKRLPQVMIDAGGNGGSNTEYTYALQSAYRLAYMHMSIDTDEDGVIEAFSYTTYQSSGSGYGDMFSRPVSYADKMEEVVDMLLYIYDQYTDDEIKTL